MPIIGLYLFEKPPKQDRVGGNTVLSYKILKSANWYLFIVQNGLTQLVLNFLDFNKQPRIGIDQIIRKKIQVLV